MRNPKFNSMDSWAIWDIPDTDLTNKTPDERQKLFGDNYQPNHSPSEKLNKDLDAKLKSSKYVIAGMNPGNAASEQPVEPFSNFHGAKKSADYRLAAALYGTEIWGSFMTDVSSTIESKSDKVKITQNDVEKFENHLDELGIPDDVTIIALGTKTFDALNKFAKRDVKKIYHYSRSNGWWKAERVHGQIEDILNK
ncbi:hypothetical protein [Companilactobacillus bobalius]|uniref:Uracil-DNA glycosylase-like domain-containing protein n=2 Tax=Companilactobacillus bobalius TaxID=2801451 RepID=A0A202FDD0_9LACO|nr:hypothetical protein [Companilactobacillus bobalius]KAE9556846.1 hypothetical protein ATN92_16335 [Companilactobacillus bobalius]OVE98489.1 hypothetical protein LKACC16343_00645 [Companilactobacillus bobalius]GEO58868.1 hypothetical protein LBO01_19970 [Companilactobacillus paralimentarius]